MKFSLIKIELDIASFMEFYQKNFPQSTVIPKMHLLEDHTVPFLRWWHIGAGLMGEQGQESIHAHLNKVEANFNSINNPLERLTYVVKQHNIDCTPTVNLLKPKPKKYKKN